MQLESLLALMQGVPQYHSLLETLRAGGVTVDQRVMRSARPFVIAALARDLKVPVIIVTASVDRAYNIAEQLPVWLPDQPILRFAETGTLFYDRAPWTEQAIRSRIAALAALCPPVGVSVKTEQPPIIVTSALALMQRTLPTREFKLGSRVLKRGTQQDPDKLLRQWLALGYIPETVVTRPGTFSRRGGIIDIFPMADRVPVRLEFFGDEIDSMRVFDPVNQRSAAQIDQVIITPAREALPKYGGAVADSLAAWFAQQPEDEAAGAIADEQELRSETAFPNLEFYLPYLVGTTASLLDYIPNDALVIVEDWEDLADTVAVLESQAITQEQEKRNTIALPTDYPLPYITWDDLREGLQERRALHLGGSFIREDEEESEEVREHHTAVIQLGELFVPGRKHGGQLRVFLDSMKQAVRNNERSVIITRQALRLHELWIEQIREKGAVLAADLPNFPEAGKAIFIEGALAEGWSFKGVEGQAEPLNLISDAEIFGWRRPEPRRRQGPRVGSPESPFSDIQVGDYVVHSEYGIGRFAGLYKREVQGGEREFFKIEFAGTDTLYVPIHQVDRLTRYVGPTDAPPQLHKLGSSDWAKSKEAARIAAEQVARELLELYAMRAHIRGHAFGPDTPWQHELEASFPYVETEDQLKALTDVKADMERDQPMDRLICGDVGYGKTEVALRAAFKAVMDGKQVAILVPTTVLAQQHFTTFSERLLPFPVKVDVISRFRTKGEQDQIVDKVRDGAIDILIGTHRLLQSDIQFKDLGLLIIDEEQRFGVTHKEKLKRMRTEVDVLTLTATPIPRTLYMSLTGVRDISLLQTPPEERQPVATHVGPYDERLVRQAILREIDRDGQVYFVHNRVSTIDSIAQKLKELVPEASLIIGHGQMHEHELEDVMAAFSSGQYDILLCTTIIESGLDIPNANTIIIDRADMFGLAQLHQLRGRVGRSLNRAYGYFFHPRAERLTDDARARLQTLAENSDLGAGMSIAMRDLEIRGTGDLLGARQSGYIASVGFHLYTQLLAQAVQRVKAGQPVPLPASLPTAPSIPIDLPVSAFVPTDFIPDMLLRMQLYRRIADVQTEEQIDTIQAELKDRFGALPPEVEGLLFNLRVKLLAYQASVTNIAAHENQIDVRLPYLAEVDRMGMQHYLGEGVRVSRTSVWIPRDEDDREWKARLLRVLAKLALNAPEAAQ
jgi:transcription-repair coupling factor (superfamily II helicase)